MDRRERRRIEREIRELAGVHEHRDGVIGLLLATLAVVALFGVGAAFFLPTESGYPASGVVVAKRMHESETETSQYATVSSGADTALVAVPAAAMCAAGDHIDLVKQKTMIGVRYALGTGGCARPGRSVRNVSDPGVPTRHPAS